MKVAIPSAVTPVLALSSGAGAGAGCASALLLRRSGVTRSTTIEA
jgi:hypothetical protein